MVNLSTWVVLMAFFTVLSKILGFIRELVLSYFFGSNALTDAFVISWNIPLVVFGGIATALLTCYVPMYHNVKSGGKKAIDYFNSNLISIVFIISLIIISVFLIFDETIIRTFFINTDKLHTQETFIYTVRFSHLMIWTMAFLGISFILQGYLQVHEQFKIVGLMGIPLNLFIISGFLLAVKFNSLFMALGVLLGYAFYVPYFAFPAYKLGFRYKPVLNFKDPNVKAIILLVIPVFFGRMVFDINLMIDRYLASGLQSGTVSCLNYANKLNLMINSVVVTSVGTTIFPRISKLVHDKKMDEVKNTLSVSLGSMSIFLVPIAFAMTSLSRPIVSLIFERGAFDATSVKITSEALTFYSISMISLGWRQIMEKVFYAMNDTKTPMINSILSISVNIILNLALIGSMQHKGLALATTVSSVTTAMLFFFKLQKKIGKFADKSLKDSFIKIIISSAIMAIFAKMIFQIADKFISKNVFVFLIVVLVSMIIYYILLKVFKVKELKIAENIIKSKIK